MNHNASFSKILRNLLDSRGVSQKWLAEEAETTEATIFRYVAGIKGADSFAITSRR